MVIAGGLEIDLQVQFFAGLDQDFLGITALSMLNFEKVGAGSQLQFSGEAIKRPGIPGKAAIYIHFRLILVGVDVNPAGYRSDHTDFAAY